MARWYKIIVGGTTFDATNNPNALQVELDITVAQFAVPHPGQAAWCRVWGIPLQTVLTANQFTNQQNPSFWRDVGRASVGQSKRARTACSGGSPAGSGELDRHEHVRRFLHYAGHAGQSDGPWRGE